jgi:hypothetical protein
MNSVQKQEKGKAMADSLTGNPIGLTPDSYMVVPDDLIMPFIEGNGVGPGTWSAAVGVFQTLNVTFSGRSFCDLPSMIILPNEGVEEVHGASICRRDRPGDDQHPLHGL